MIGRKTAISCGNSILRSLSLGFIEMPLNNSIQFNSYYSCKKKEFENAGIGTERLSLKFVKNRIDIIVSCIRVRKF
ncbi:hypothetical protein LEP1GSC162_1961 [Leptospira santarosai str. CBC1531]|nr:hypothetical protein LEP1GSC162_1961 [Leptospira santarosai str. CBC1531]